MKIVAISDTHQAHHQVVLPKGDVLIHAGDVSRHGTAPEISNFLTWFSAQPHRYKIFIAGNHDFLFEDQPTLARSLIPDNIIYLENSGTVIEGISIWGSPIQPEFYNWAFNRKRGTEIKAYWDAIPMHTDILITHGPPYGILDKTVSGYLAGCEELALAVSRLQPKHHLFGHIHEGYGKLKTKTNYINASLLNESYMMVNKPVVFHITKKV